MPIFISPCLVALPVYLFLLAYSLIALPICNRNGQISNPHSYSIDSADDINTCVQNLRKILERYFLSHSFNIF